MKATVHIPTPPPPTITLELSVREAQALQGLLFGRHWHAVREELDRMYPEDAENVDRRASRVLNEMNKVLSDEFLRHGIKRLF